MSLRVSLAAVRTYDALKRRPGARPRQSDARDMTLLQAVEERLTQFVQEYQITGQRDVSGITYIFWTEVQVQIDRGAFDDLLDRL